MYSYKAVPGVGDKLTQWAVFLGWLQSEIDVAVYSVKENFQLNGADMQSKVMRTMLGLFAEIERDLISARTKEGLSARKAQGVKLGRPKGFGKSKLDEFKPEIEALLVNGFTKRFIARRYGISEPALYNWLKKIIFLERHKIWMFCYCGHTSVNSNSLPK